MAKKSSDADADYKRRVLAAAPIFQTTPEDDLAELARCGKMIAIARGKPVAKPGATNVFIVQTGVIAGLQADHESAKPVLTVLFGPGAVCGVQTALTDPEQRDSHPPAEARCLTDVSAISLPLPDLLRVARRSTELSQSLMTVLATHTDETAQLLAQSLRRPLELRLANIFSRIGDLIAGDDWRPTVGIGKISQSFAAEMLGVSREHVNRTLTMWEKSGLIFQNKSGEILIQNRKRLSVLASDKTAAPQSAKDSDWIWEIDSYLDFGLNQTAYHLAMEAARRAPKDMRFRHRAVLATARGGAMAEALALIDKLDLKHDYSDEELGCLRPRILRDMAFTTSDEELKKQYLVDSAEEYAKVFEKCRTHYSGLNAAYGYAFLNDSERAKGIASVVADIAQEKLEPLDEDDDSFWLRTTVAECKLMQGDLPAAAQLFQNACNAEDVTPGKKASTRLQLRRVAPHAGIDDAWIDRSVPQKGTLFFSGPLAGKAVGETDELIDIVVDDIKDYLRKTPVGWACGALASGCDIAIAEVLLEAGVSLNVYLPLAPNDFMKSSVSAFGDQWRQRFTDCMRAATAIEWNRRASVAAGPTYRLGALVAMGKTIRHADELQSQANGFFAAQKNRNGDKSLSIANMEVWDARGLPYAETRGVWPKKDTNGSEEKLGLYYALILQMTEGATALADIVKSAVSTIEMPAVDCTVLLYESQEDAYRAAMAMTAEKGADKIRIWLDTGVFNKEAGKNTPESAADNLITASCRPLSDPGKVYASEAFACIAATGLAPERRFEYVGYANAQEKLDPCPLYLVG